MQTPGKLLECVPNISEGRDRKKIDAIAAEAESVEGVKVLHIDAGPDVNRTVITFVGEPERVLEAAFRVIKKAAECIDMRVQKGAHPRMGATDVCPLIPLRGMDMDEVVELAHRLGKRVGDELGIPGYFYGSAARSPLRTRLEYCRKGEYEGLGKLETEAGRPDFGPAKFGGEVKKTGAVAIGARQFLIAYNINLNTSSARLATELAMDIRESGRIQRRDGQVVRDEKGIPVRIPGALKHVKALGWYVEGFGLAQVTMNLTDINETPLHVVFDEACRLAETRGLRVTGSEIVGMVPKRCLLEAADHYLAKQGKSLGLPELEKVSLAIRTLGLNEVSPFDPCLKVIEYAMGEGKLGAGNLRLESFADAVLSEKPMPGGGCVSAYCGALGAALGGMVANISAGKRGWEDRRKEFSDWALKAESLKARLLRAVDEDMESFDALVAAVKRHRKMRGVMGEGAGEELQAARKNAVEVPMRTAALAAETFPLLQKMAETGTPTAVADAAVGAMCARTAILGATLNARHNLAGLHDDDFAKRTVTEIERLEALADAMEQSVRDRANPSK